MNYSCNKVIFNTIDSSQLIGRLDEIASVTSISKTKA